MERAASDKILLRLSVSELATPITDTNKAKNKLILLDHNLSYKKDHGVVLGYRHC